MIALFLSILLGQAQAAADALPLEYSLLHTESGLPLLYYEELGKGGILSFKLEPKYLPGEIPAPLAAKPEARFPATSRFIREGRCTQTNESGLFCEWRLTEVGERMLLAVLNGGYQPLIFLIALKSSIPLGSANFLLSAKVQSPYFTTHPILINK